MASKRIIISSAVDWLVIIAAIIIALLLSTVNPDFHTFSVLDLNLSYPYRPPKLSLWLFILLSIIFPFLTIISISLLTPIQTYHPPQHNLTPSQIRIQKLKYLNASLLGLGVSLATSTVIFTGVKNLTGKPRPNFLSVCDPDLENIEKYTVEGVGAAFNKLWVMVDGEICRQSDNGILKDGFRSFPSGYATIAFAGLWYLSLFLCHRFGVVFPSSTSPRNILIPRDFDANEQIEPLLSNGLDPGRQSPLDLDEVDEELGAFPVYKLLLPYIPLGLAIFIAGTRYFDFRNHGFDVLAGAVIGSITAYTGFRIYHPSLLGTERAV